jgi:hypothetical protein
MPTVEFVHVISSSSNISKYCIDKVDNIVLSVFHTGSYPETRHIPRRGIFLVSSPLLSRLQVQFINNIQSVLYHYSEYFQYKPDLSILGVVFKTCTYVLVFQELSTDLVMHEHHRPLLPEYKARHFTSPYFQSKTVNANRHQYCL